MLAKILSIKLSLSLLFILALSAAISTFIENDFGTPTAWNMVYNALWYELLLGLTALQMLGVILRSEMILSSLLFHLAFVLILLGALVTRYGGFEAYITLAPMQESNKVLSAARYINISLESKGNKITRHYPFSLGAFRHDFKEELVFDNKHFNISVKEVDFKYGNRRSDSIMKIEVENEGKILSYSLKDKQFVLGKVHNQSLDGVRIGLSYGSKEIKLPFSIKLMHFDLQKYPGSTMESGYSSYVQIHDKNTSLSHHIYMNNTLSYKGYKFFQSSHHEGKSTLSVNKDPGLMLTYSAYGLLFFALIFNLFDKKSRFNMLRQRLGSMHFVFLIMILPFSDSYGAENNQKYFQTFAQETKKSAEIYAHLNVQTPSGKTKIMDTLNRQIIYKLSGKNELYGLTANQISLGMLIKSKEWKKVKLLKIKSSKLKKLIGVKGDYASYDDFFNKKGYKLDYALISAKSKPITLRTVYDKDLIKVDEKVHISSMVYKGRLFKIFIQKDNENWLNFNNAWQDNNGVFRPHIKALLDAGYNQNYTRLEKELLRLKDLQKKSTSDLLLSNNRIWFEALFNKMEIFPRLTLAYIFLSIGMLVFSFSSIFFKVDLFKRGFKVLYYLLLISFSFHIFGLISRYILAGYVPLSNTYESIIFISFSSVLAGVTFFRKSSLALSASASMGAVFMFVAHLNAIDPQVTSLVPVLNSFWLSIHVSIITASYGFLALSALLGYFTLLLLLSSKSKQIKYIRDINETSMILGLFMLVIGNFLGSIWANESWGRYWAWDPKETWTYISILLYVIVLHLRLIKPLNTSFAFSLGSIVSFFSIIMTYFGVNFYLSGKHSYAKADQLIFPQWLYYIVVLIFITALISYISIKRRSGSIR